jgi:hypothetical protein
VSSDDSLSTLFLTRILVEMESGNLKWSWLAYREDQKDLVKRVNAALVASLSLLSVPLRMPPVRRLHHSSLSLLVSSLLPRSGSASRRLFSSNCFSCLHGSCS